MEEQDLLESYVLQDRKVLDKEWFLRQNEISVNKVIIELIPDYKEYHLILELQVIYDNREILFQTLLLKNAHLDIIEIKER